MGTAATNWDTLRKQWSNFRKRFDDPHETLTELEWNNAYKKFFYERVHKRYLAPITTLKTVDSFHGEGFSIVTILCSLIEFLESTVVGKNYSLHLDKDPSIRQFQYNKSGTFFKKFLLKRASFKGAFTKAQAIDFYENVRCGLVHEACTKNNWLIRVAKKHQTSLIGSEGKDKIIYRNNFETAITNFLTWYENQLRSNDRLQRAFVRKMDHIYL